MSDILFLDIANHMTDVHIIIFRLLSQVLFWGISNNTTKKQNEKNINFVMIHRQKLCKHVSFFYRSI